MNDTGTLRDQYLSWNNDLNKQTFLKNRGFELETCSRYCLGFNQENNSITIPIDDNCYMEYFIDSQHEPRYINDWKLWNEKAVEDEKPCIITDNPIEALSVIESGLNAIALNSKDNRHQLEELLSSDKAKANLIVLSLSDYETQEKLFSNLSSKNIPVITFSLKDRYESINERLLQDKLEMAKDCFKIIEKANGGIEDIKEWIRSNNEDAYNLEFRVFDAKKKFLEYVEKNKNSEDIKTGFKCLDSVLGGGLSEGLYMIGAVSTLGKTAFTMQVADFIASTGKPVLVFTLEMSRNELISRSISRETYVISKDRNFEPIDEYGKSGKEIRKGVVHAKPGTKQEEGERAIIEDSMNKYFEYAKNIYIIEGDGKVSLEIIEQHINEFNKVHKVKPIIIIDYFQIIQPNQDSLKKDIRLIADQNISRLKFLSRENETAIIAISSMSRGSYNAGVGMDSFKESGGIEYGADALLGLEYKGIGKTDSKTEANEFMKRSQKRTPREIVLSVLKNRSGETGDEIEYDFYSKYSFFKEKGFKKDNDTEKASTPKKQKKERKQRRNIARGAFRSR